MPDSRAGFFDERAHRPIHCAMADAKDEVLQILFAARRVRDFRMKLQAVKFALGIFDRGKVRVLAASRGAKAVGQRRHLVAVTAPNIELWTDSFEERRAVCDLQQTGPVFAPRAEL